MTEHEVKRLSAREGYDRWAETYDATANPVVAMDARHTYAMLDARPGERVLDAGCGTGRHFVRLVAEGVAAIGGDFSTGMLDVLRRRTPRANLACFDLSRDLPFAARSFDAVLCSLVGEHLADLGPVFAEFARVLKPAGRLVFSVYHPRMAHAGKEAHFVRGGVEYRLGAERHDVDDYTQAMRANGLEVTDRREWSGDAELASAIPNGERYLDFPLLLVLTGRPRAR